MRDTTEGKELKRLKTSHAKWKARGSHKTSMRAATTYLHTTCGWSLAKIAEEIGESRSYVAKLLPKKEGK